MHTIHREYDRAHKRWSCLTGSYQNSSGLFVRTRRQVDVFGGI